MGIDVEDLFSRIKDVIIKTCISAESNMMDIHAKASEHRTNCFELYGFDVLIDSKLKPWILEVNVCPSLSSSSPLDRKIKHSLLVDTFNIIGITPYDKKHF
jgi:tubulin polyglutamylase TTLL4